VLIGLIKSTSNPLLAPVSQLFAAQARRTDRLFRRGADEGGQKRDKIDHDYLAPALDRLLAGKAVETVHVDAVGCLIGSVREPDARSDVTYSRQIVRIFQLRRLSLLHPLHSLRRLSLLLAAPVLAPEIFGRAADHWTGQRTTGGPIGPASARVSSGSRVT
jgi:hypothetical protein